MPGKHKKIKLIASVVILCVLAFVVIKNTSFKSVKTYNTQKENVVKSGNDGGIEYAEVSESPDSVIKDENVQKKNKAADTDKNKDDTASKGDSTNKKSNSSKSGSTEKSKAVSTDKPAAKTKHTSAPGATQDTSGTTSSSGNDADSGSSTTNTDSLASTTTDSSNSGNNSTDSANSTVSGTSTPEPTTVYYDCTITIKCDELSRDTTQVAENLRKYIPSDGVILKTISVSVAKGTSVYSLLSSVCKKNNIALDAIYESLYSTYYVKGINYLYEKAAGGMSGWVYTVNSKSPNVGAGTYKIKDGDSIVWSYTVDGEE